MVASTERRPPKLLFLVTEDWYFCSHRLLLARAAKRSGYDVTVATRVRDHGKHIKAEGFCLVPIRLDRRSMNPWFELRALAELTRIYRSLRPDIVHHVAVKPILYGSVAARLAGVNRVVNALAGLGYIFTSDHAKARLGRPLVELAYKWALRGSRVIVQNPDDVDLLIAKRVAEPQDIDIVPGSGVDVASHAWRPEPPGVLVVFPGRFLFDKGVREFVEAARRLRAHASHARFALVGDTDPGNPGAVPRSQLEAWREEGCIEWWGWRSDMPTVYAAANIVCLPSYREGLPRALVEAAACARPIVTSDVPGCREIVRHQENGLLVPARDVNCLITALQRLIEDPSLRAQMGERGRKIAESEFSAESVNTKMLRVYQELLV